MSLSKVVPISTKIHQNNAFDLISKMTIQFLILLLFHIEHREISYFFFIFSNLHKAPAFPKAHFPSNSVQFSSKFYASSRDHEDQSLTWHEGNYCTTKVIFLQSHLKKIGPLWKLSPSMWLSIELGLRKKNRVCRYTKFDIFTKTQFYI